MSDTTTPAKPGPKKPTARQRRVGERLVTEPETPATTIVAQEGYKAPESQVTRVVNSHGVQISKREALRNFRSTLDALDSVVRAARRLSALINNESGKVALGAIDRILEHYGVQEPRDRMAIIVTVQQQSGTNWSPVL